MPHYFYMHNISLDDFGAIQTARGGIYIFTTGTPYKISSRALLPPSLRTGIFTVKCACPESFRYSFSLGEAHLCRLLAKRRPAACVCYVDTNPRRERIHKVSAQGDEGC